MRPADFTPEQIIEAGQALQNGGKSVTGFALRRAVGGGNAQRLKQVWDEFQASQSVATREPVAELPVEVAEQLAQIAELFGAQLNALVVSINDRAVKASERRVAEVVRTAGNQREQAERELADASQAVEELEQQLVTAAEVQADLRGRLDRLHEEKQAQAVELAKLGERLATVEKATKAAANAASEQEKALRKQMAELGEQLAEQRRLEQMAREREAQAVGVQAALQRQHEEDAEICLRLRSEAQAATRALDKATVTVEQQAAKLDAVGQALKDAQAEAKSAQLAAAEASGREQAALAQVKGLIEAAQVAQASKPPAAE